VTLMNIFTHITNLIFLLEAELRGTNPIEIREDKNLIKKKPKSHGISYMIAMCDF